MAYIYQEFPKWRYHRDGRSVVVKNAAEEAALGPGWEDKPVAFPRWQEPEPELPQQPEPEAQVDADPQPEPTEVQPEPVPVPPPIRPRGRRRNRS